VKIGDIVIAYGVGTTKILSYYRVISEPSFVTSNVIKKDPWKARWPWFIVGKNLSPKYGKVWAKSELTLRNLVNEYNQYNSDRILTKVGGKNLKALNRGKDKINLNTKFAEFIINKINAVQ
jgi:hypothetical protein